MAIIPDDKDWTWVLERVCADCGFDPHRVRRADVPDRILRSSAGWDVVLTQPDSAVRPDDSTWSVLEYGCHIRDVHRIMNERLQLMVEYDETRSAGAEFANWDQDATAVERRYGEQNPTTVAVELFDAAETFAAHYRRVRADQWARRGFHSNGSAFTVESFAAYALHDLEHHRVDVGLAAR